MEQTESEENIESVQSEGAVIPDEPAPDYVGFCDVKFLIENGDWQRSIDMYLNGKEAYVFLPSYASLSETSFCFGDNIESIAINGKNVKNGQTLKNFNTDEIYDLSVKLRNDEDDSSSKDIYSLDDANEETYKTELPVAQEIELPEPIQTLKTYDMYQLTIMQSANLPALYIDTANGTMDYLNQDKTHWEPGEMLCIDENGALDSEGDIRKIHGRGSSSWGNKQKGYTFHTTNKTAFMGMKKATKWCLIANSYDATKLRNALAYAFARDIELPYAIDCRYIDVYFNGKYNGNYLLCEAIEVNDKRIDPEDVDVLLKVDRLGPGSVYFSWDNGVLETLYPVNESEDYYRNVRSRMNYIFTKISNCSTHSDYEKLKNLVDIDSFAKMYLINFMTNDTDSNGLSTYYYYKADEGKLYSGPAWDFDLGYGAEQDNRGRYYKYNGYGCGPSEKMIYIPEFADHVSKVLQQYDEAVDNIEKNRIEFTEEIESSLLMSRKLYGNQSGGWMVEMGRQEANEYYLEDFLKKRIPLMYDTVFYPEKYHRITINNRILWLQDGESISKDFEEFLCGKDGHLRYESGLTYLRSQPLLWDMTLYTPPAPVAEESEEQAVDLQDVEQTVPVEQIANDTQASPVSTTIINEQQQEEKGDILMAILGIILLVTPGIISLLVSGYLKELSRKLLPEVAIAYLIYEFLTIMIAYGIITIVKGSVTISFAGVSHGENYTIFHSNVVFLMTALFLVISVTLGWLKKYYDSAKDRIVIPDPSSKLDIVIDKLFKSKQG